MLHALDSLTCDLDDDTSEPCEDCEGTGLALFLRGEREVLDRCPCGIEPDDGL